MKYLFLEDDCLNKKKNFLLLFLVTLPLSYLLFSYLVQIYFYGLILIFFLIFLQTPRPSRTVDEEELDRSKYILGLLTVLTFSYGLGGILGIII